MVDTVVVVKEHGGSVKVTGYIRYDKGEGEL